MSRTVSFRASEDLDEFLEEEAERRMTTKSTVAQMLVAERAQRLRGDLRDPDEGPGAESEVVQAIFKRHPDKWHVPDSDEGYEYAVRTTDGKLKYYKTADGAASRLSEEYE